MNHIQSSRLSSVIQDVLPLTAVTVHNLSALAARDLDKFLVSVGRQPSYVDLEVIFFSALLIFHCLLVFICIYIPFVG